MNGFERLEEQIKDQEDIALKQTISYLQSRTEMEENFLKEDKTVDGMCEFIHNKAQKCMKNKWSYITNEMVYAWAIMYFSLPNSFFKIADKKVTTKKQEVISSKKSNNVISLENEKKKRTSQLSLFGGIENE